MEWPVIPIYLFSSISLPLWLLKNKTKKNKRRKDTKARCRTKKLEKITSYRMLSFPPFISPQASSIYHSHTSRTPNHFQTNQKKETIHQSNLVGLWFLVSCRLFYFYGEIGDCCCFFLLIYFFYFFNEGRGGVLMIDAWGY